MLLECRPDDDLRSRGAIGRVVLETESIVRVHGVHDLETGERLADGAEHLVQIRISGQRTVEAQPDLRFDAWLDERRARSAVMSHEHCVGEWAEVWLIDPHLGAHRQRGVAELPADDLLAALQPERSAGALNRVRVVDGEIDRRRDRVTSDAIASRCREHRSPFGDLGWSQRHLSSGGDQGDGVCLPTFQPASPRSAPARAIGSASSGVAIESFQRLNTPNMHTTPRISTISSSLQCRVSSL